MVDVGAKPATQRRAVAGGRITMSPEALEAIRSGNAPKGDVLSTARIAGIMAAKRTADLIPLRHPLALTKVGIDFTWEAGRTDERRVGKERFDKWSSRRSQVHEKKK